MRKRTFYVTLRLQFDFLRIFLFRIDLTNLSLAINNVSFTLAADFCAAVNVDLTLGNVEVIHYFRTRNTANLL